MACTNAKYYYLQDSIGNSVQICHILKNLLKRARQQYSHNAIFDLITQNYSIKILDMYPSINCSCLGIPKYYIEGIFCHMLYHYTYLSP